MPDQVAARLPSGSGGCLTLQFSRGGLYLAAAINDHGRFPIRLFQIAGIGNVGVSAATLFGELPGHANVVYDLCWSANDTMLLSASSDCTACLWDLNTPALAPALKLQHPCFVYAARLHPAKSTPRTANTGAFDGIVRLWSLETQQCVELAGHQGPVNAIELDPSGYKVGKQPQYTHNSMHTQHAHTHSMHSTIHNPHVANC